VITEDGLDENLGLDRCDVHMRLRLCLKVSISFLRAFACVSMCRRLTMAQALKFSFSLPPQTVALGVLDIAARYDILTLGVADGAAAEANFINFGWHLDDCLCFARNGWKLLSLVGRCACELSRCGDLDGWSMEVSLVKAFRATAPRFTKKPAVTPARVQL
jgi:hypothetical protein